MNVPEFLRIAALAFGLTPSVAFPQASCSKIQPVPDVLASKDVVEDYSSVLKLCFDHGGASRVATREMRIGGMAALLLVNSDTLNTELQSASCWTCHDVSEDSLSATRLMRSAAQSAEAPGLSKRGFLQNAGLTHGDGEGVFLTGDLCPSSKPLERGFIDQVAKQEPHAPIALSISGLWLTHHFQDYRWLLDRQAAGAVDIIWINHSYHHQFKRGVPFDRNFMLTPGVDADSEILDTERLLIANGQIPSVFFRFPGLISSAPLMEAARSHHLVSLGAGAWLALQQRPKSGSIVLVHPNGNEPAGLRIYERDVADGTMPQPLEPLLGAPP
jgi:hypothetical protein